MGLHSHRFAPEWQVGHWTDPSGATGCTVLLPPRGNVASCDIRGSAPGERELALLHPDRRLSEIHAILLTGGSAFGLAAAQGVVSWLEDRGVGYATRAGPVPIVPAAVIFDLAQSGPSTRPGPTEGRAACDAAAPGDVATGRVGAGAGATVGKWAGFEASSPGGLGVAGASSGSARVHAIAVVNSVGDVVAADGSVVAGSRAPLPAEPGVPAQPPGGELGSTVLAVVVVDGRVTKADARWLAARGSDGITTSIRPAHTRYDGDVVISVGRGNGRPGGTELDLLGRLATEAVAKAVRNAVKT